MLKPPKAGRAERMANAENATASECVVLKEYDFFIRELGSLARDWFVCGNRHFTSEIGTGFTHLSKATEHASIPQKGGFDLTGMSDGFLRRTICSWTVGLVDEWMNG